MPRAVAGAELPVSANAGGARCQPDWRPRPRSPRRPRVTDGRTACSSDTAMPRFATAALLVAGCTSPLPAVPPGRGCQATLEVPQAVRNQLDLLFVVDNSSSMAPMADALKLRFGDLVKVFDDLARAGMPVDLHVGVVTTDYGAGDGRNPCGPSPGGQMGKLQAVGLAAPPACRPPEGARFIAWRYRADGTSVSNLPAGQDLAATFACMASVGTAGCGFEHPLESAYAALHNNLPENQGFLRDGALLAVVFLTNEDDASAPPDSDVFDDDKTAQYGCPDSYDRQTRFAVVCCPPGVTSCDRAQKVFPPDGDSLGPLAGCEPAPVPPGKQYDVGRYIDFFTRPALQGGVKADPRDVILAAIDAPEQPFQVLVANPSATDGAPWVPCAPDPPSDQWCTQCAPVLQHACANPQAPGFFGDPAVRLNTVVRAAKQHAITSICDGDYTKVFGVLFDQLAVELGTGCVPFTPTEPVECVVEEETRHADGTTAVTAIPRCGDPPGAFPCWRFTVEDACALASPIGAAFTVDRGGADAPPDSVVRVACDADC